jgi:hypothetical protein
MLACSYRDIATIGALNFVAVPVLAWLTMSGFVSLWCFWAAIVSVLVARHLRRTRPATPARGLKVFVPRPVNHAEEGLRR